MAEPKWGAGSTQNALPCAALPGVARWDARNCSGTASGDALRQFETPARSHSHIPLSQFRLALSHSRCQKSRTPGRFVNPHPTSADNSTIFIIAELERPWNIPPDGKGLKPTHLSPSRGCGHAFNESWLPALQVGKLTIQQPFGPHEVIPSHQPSDECKHLSRGGEY